MHSPTHGGGWAPEAPLYLVGTDTSARPHLSWPLHQGSSGLVLNFFVWEGLLIRPKTMMSSSFWGRDSPRRTANHGRSDLDPGGFCALENSFFVFEQI